MELNVHELDYNPGCMHSGRKSCQR